MPFKIVAYLTVYCSIEKVESSPILFAEHLTYRREHYSTRIESYYIHSCGFSYHHILHDLCHTNVIESLISNYICETNY